MIFVSVGSQTPFDRLITAVDAWAHGKEVAIVAQIGAGRIVPRYIEWFRFCAPQEFAQRCAAAEVLVSHAGMGCVLTALEHGIPLVMLPRRATLGETRNDHQLATARWLGGRAGIYVAESPLDLGTCIERALRAGRAGLGPSIGASASSTLVNALRDFIHRAA